MKARLNPLAIAAAALLLSFLPDPALAQVSLRWNADTARPASVDYPLFHGETAALEPSFTSYGSSLALSNTVATLYWQTNGMGAAWWSKPAEIVPGTPDRIRAIFHPTNDTGSEAYSFFVRVDQGNWSSYRAFGTLSMRTSPGYIPNVVAPPVQSLDFSTLQLIHSPWLVSSEWQAGSNALAEAVQTLTADVSRQLESNRVAVAAHTARTDNPHGVTAAQVGAITNGQVFTSLSVYTNTPGAWVVSEYEYCATPGAYGAYTYNGYNANGWRLYWNVGNQWWEITDPEHYHYYVSVNNPGDNYIHFNRRYDPNNDDGSQLVMVTAPHDPIVLADTTGLKVALKSDLTGLLAASQKELHADSFTNLIWREVYSNGWKFALAYTNTP